MKKILALTLALMLALSLCACGSSDANEAMYGTYTLYAMDYDEETVVLASELFEGESYITLKSGGSADICLENDVSAVTWKADGDALVFTADDGDMDATLIDGVLTLMLDGTNLYFVGENASTAGIHAVTIDEMLGGLADDMFDDALEELEIDEPVPAEESELQKLWNGWYYGCVDITGSTGGWEWANNLTFDAAMEIDLDADGYGTLIIYDPYGEIALNPEHNNRYVVIDCHADEMYLYGDSGTAFDYDIYVNDWRVVRNLANSDKLNVGSSFTDADGNRMGYDFTFLPWGDRWEDESYSVFIPHFDEYLSMLDAGRISPFDDGTAAEAPAAPAESGGEEIPAAPAESGAGSLSPLLGSSPARLDINGKGAVYVYYPADEFEYDDDYGKLKNADTGVGILIDPMLGHTNFDELKASYEENNSDEEDYSLTEMMIGGYKAMVMTYSDWLGSTMRVDIDFGGEHDGFYGMSFAVSGDSLFDCDSDIVWAIIESMEVVK